MQSIDQKIFARIKKHGAGWVFSPIDFLDLAGRSAVGVNLHRMVQSKTIRRLARGLYDYPKTHPVMGTLSPSPTRVAEALSEKEAVRLQPSGAYAANLLGLSEQVPAKIVFFTDGRAKRVKFGRQEIVLKRTTPKSMATAGRISGLVFQALRYTGKEHITDALLARLRAKLSEADKRQLRKDMIYAPAWIADIVRKLE